jgi:hypothetical protein
LFIVPTLYMMMHGKKAKKSEAEHAPMVPSGTSPNLISPKV